MPRVTQKDWKFRMRDVVKDDVSTMQGVVMGISLQESGCTHVGIASQELKDSKPVGWHWFDDSRLEKLSVCKGFSPKSWLQKWQMGDVLRDSTSGIEGKVVEIVFYATGCIQYGLQQHGTCRDSKMIDIQYIGQERLDRVKRAEVADAEKKTAKKRPPSPPCQSTPSHGG